MQNKDDLGIPVYKYCGKLIVKYTHKILKFSLFLEKRKELRLGINPVINFSTF